MLNVKEALDAISNPSNLFFYDGSELNKILIVRYFTDLYSYGLYFNSVKNDYYLNISSIYSIYTVVFQFGTNEIHCYVIGDNNDNIKSKVPDRYAADDEWFNYNIQHGSLQRTDIDPVLYDLRPLLHQEYNRVLMTILNRVMEK